MVNRALLGLLSEFGAGENPKKGVETHVYEIVGGARAKRQGRFRRRADYYNRGEGEAKG